MKNNFLKYFTLCIVLLLSSSNALLANSFSSNLDNTLPEEISFLDNENTDTNSYKSTQKENRSLIFIEITEVEVEENEESSPNKCITSLKSYLKSYLNFYSALDSNRHQKNAINTYNPYFKKVTSKLHKKIQVFII